MAEGALFALAGKVISVLGSLIAEEVKLAFGVKTDIEYLRNTVSTIQAVILDAEKQSSHSHQIKDWLSKLKDVLHDADDLLDDFSTQVLRRKVISGNKMKKEVRLCFSSSNQLYFSVKMGHELKAIRKRLNAIADDRMKFNLNENCNEPQVMNRGRETCSFVPEDEVIGREDDKKEIMERLFDDNVKENISIIPIVGIGGMGKTTLAQLVYKDENVENKFELKLWICVSDNLDIKRVIKEVLAQLKVQNDEECFEEVLAQLKVQNDEECFEVLQKKLRDKLEGKKCLIVLDDLWNEELDEWLPLRNLFLGATMGSRIIVTTRSERVARIVLARIVGATSWHTLRGLSKEKAWSLLVKMAFEQGQEPNNKALVALGEKIVEMCDGLPLAIRTIGSLLYRKISENEWQSFLDDELSKIGQQENKISSTLKLSYDHLPPHLKQCFAYCRLFPKDDRIDVYTLINLWAAQGFIVLVGPKQRFEDVGRKYFKELLWRSFFQDVENDYFGNIISCKMHDLMHDLACLVSGTESAIVNSSGENDIEKVRHVSFNLVYSSMQFSNGRKIRTFLASSIWGNWVNLTSDTFISNFKYLRTLDLSDQGLLVVPHSIGKLKHLRYLDLSRNYEIKILPNSITKMLNLQTLILEGCGSLRELPKGIKKLVNLRFLDITGCSDELTNMPLEIEHLTCLETILPGVVVRKEGSGAKSNGGPSQLKELHNLGGKLIIENLGYGKDDVWEYKDANLNDKQHLQQLELHWGGSWDGESECDEMLEGLQLPPNLKWLELRSYMGMRMPSCVSSLTNLVHFDLSGNKRLQHLPPLNQLPFLESVSLVGMEALEYVSDEESGFSKSPFFPSLSSLLIRDCPKLKGWWRNEPHHLLLPSFPPSLSTLSIIHCPNLTYMPPFPYLKERLTLGGCSWKVLEQTMKMGAATTSTYFPLSQLQHLHLFWMNDFESLPEEWLRNLVSLRKLSISICSGLVSLPWIGSLTSLQTLYIMKCDNLMSLPQEIRNLTSLKELQIRNCPLLGQRCKRQIGADWPIIAHVPLVRVDGQNQQEETISSES